MYEPYACYFRRKWDQCGWGRRDLAAAVVEVGVSVDRAGDPDPCGYGASGNSGVGILKVINPQSK